MHGCNYFGKSTIRSAPFAIFGRQDILTLAFEMDDMWKSGLKEKYREKLLKCGKISETFKMPESLIPEIYGTIENHKGTADGLVHVRLWNPHGETSAPVRYALPEQPKRMGLSDVPSLQR